MKKSIAKRFIPSSLNPQASILARGIKSFFIHRNLSRIQVVLLLGLFPIVAMTAVLPKHRIITLAPNLAEIVYAAGAGRYLVGVSVATDYPPPAKRIPVVANYNSCDIERVVSLKPDLVIAWYSGTSFAEVKQLKALGIPVYIAQFNQMEDVPRVVRDVGQLAGTSEAAESFVRSFNNRYQQLKTRYAHQPRVNVFFQLSLSPLMTLNHHSLVTNVIETCGGKNIFSQAFGLAPQVSIESIIKASPDVLLISAEQEDYQKSKRFWNQYPELSAVKNHFIFSVNPDWIERYGPRILDGMALTCQAIDQARPGSNLLHYRGVYPSRTFQTVIYKN